MVSAIKVMPAITDQPDLHSTLGWGGGGRDKEQHMFWTNAMQNL